MNLNSKNVKTLLKSIGNINNKTKDLKFDCLGRAKFFPTN